MYCTAPYRGATTAWPPSRVCFLFWGTRQGQDSSMCGMSDSFVAACHYCDWGITLGSSSSSQSFAKLYGLTGWSSQLKSSWFLLFFSSPCSLLIQAASSCAEGSFHGVREYEKQRNGKLSIHQDPLDSARGASTCVRAVGGLNFGCLIWKLLISVWISKLLWEHFRLNEKQIP